MKYVVVLGDGMADFKLSELGGKTPLEYANKPNIDNLAKISDVGLVKTVPEGLKPGSDIANLSVLGYNPRYFYSGRSPLEAVSIGIDLKDTDITYRCNLVTLSDEENYEDKTMLDYSAGEISTFEARELIHYLKKYFDDEDLELFAGVSYRHCLVYNNGILGHNLTPPHDISDKPIKNYLPEGELADKFIYMMKESYKLLKNHPLNLKRIAEGKKPANSIWLWGEGSKPMLENFHTKYGLKGGVISAVDLIRGIGILADMKIIEVPNITGNYDTNFLGKANAALEELSKGLDFVYIHMEAPDECGHQGNMKNKIYSIEQIDEKVVKVLVDGLNKMGEDYSILIMPDHPTPIAIKTHTSDPVPFLIYKSNRLCKYPAPAYDEFNAKNTGLFIEQGYTLMDRFLKN